MTDLIQILLIVVISLLTFILFIMGWEVFQILKEFKKSLEKMNKILDDTGRITEAVAEPAVELSNFLLEVKHGFTGLTHGLEFLKKVKNFFENRKEKAPEHPSAAEENLSEETNEPAKAKPKAKFSSQLKPRFFLKKGKSLGKTS